MILLLLCCGVAGLVAGLQTKPKDDRGDFHAIIKEYWEWRLKEAPEFATSVGVQQYDDQLESFTLISFNKRKEDCEEFSRRLQLIDSWRLSPREAIDLAVLKYDISAYINGYQWRLYGGLNPVNFLEGIHKDYSYWLDAMRFEDEDGFRKYLNRLRALASQVYQQINLMREAIRRGFTNHRVSVEGVPNQMPRLEVQPISTPFYKPFNDSLQYAHISSNKADRLREEGEAVILDQVIPAYKKLKVFVSKEYMYSTRYDMGVGMSGEGFTYYKACLKWHLSLDMSPYTLHEIGKQTVDNIIERVILIKERTGNLGTLQEFIRYALGASKFFYRSEQEVLQKYTDIVQRKIPPRLKRLFYRTELSPPQIQPMSFDGPLGVMMPGSEDGAMPAIFFVNVQNPLSRPRWQMTSLSLHETLPGRYLQGSYVRNQTVPLFRKFREIRKMHAIPFQFPYHAAFTEGWALYAESLGHDMDLYNNPYDEFGQLHSELYKACEIVVDTGIHALGWSKKKAIEYLRERTMAPVEHLEVAVNRIITFPGQAVAPEFGHLKIKQLRKKAESKFGEWFDIKEFHEKMLQIGPVPLSILERHINRWIDMYAPKSSKASTQKPNILTMCLRIGFLYIVTRNSTQYQRAS